jgi:hypothetical protein
MPVASRTQSLFRSLPYYRSAASSKASSPHSAIYCFPLQFPVSSRFPKIISSCLRLILRVPVTFSLPFISYSITCFRRQFPHKMWPIQFAFLLFTVCRIFISLLTLCNTFSSVIWSVHPTFPISLQQHLRTYCVSWNMPCHWTKSI